MPTLRSRERRTPSAGESLSLMCDEPDGMAATFGSIAEAGAAWKAWRDLPELRVNPGLRCAAWWCFEPGVPEDLRSTDAFVLRHPELAEEAAAIGDRHVYSNPEFTWSILIERARRAYLEDRFGEVP